MAGLFKKNGRARRIPEKLAQYDDEYLLYCVEKDRVETVLERTLHTMKFQQISGILKLSMNRK